MKKTFDKDFKELGILRNISVEIDNDNSNKVIVSISDKNNKKVTKSYEFDSDQELESSDRILISILMAFGYDIEDIIDFIDSDDESENNNDVMNFYDEKTSVEKSNYFIDKFKEIIRNKEE